MLYTISFSSHLMHFCKACLYMMLHFVFLLGSMSAPVGWCLLSYSLGILAAGSQVLMHFCTLKKRTSWVTTHPHCQAKIPRHQRKGACRVVTEAQSQVGPATEASQVPAHLPHRAPHHRCRLSPKCSHLGLGQWRGS